jgi:ornithine lipid ester-linked acyl 2-hydroxylase
MGSLESAERNSVKSPDQPMGMGERETRKSPADSARQAAAKVLSRFIVWFDDRIPAHSKVSMDPLIARDDFPWADVLESDWQEVRAELDELMTHYDALPNIQDIATDQYGLSQDDKWKTYFFSLFGEKYVGNRRRCPKTAALLDSIPGLTTAFFSILGPGKYIRPHCGYYRGVVRYHLALKVPQNSSACGIRVGKEVVHWTEGAGFLFDDTYRHEAWNKTPEVRVVLLLDVMRPLPFPYSFLNKIIVYGMARVTSLRKAKANLEAWERGFEKVFTGK